MKILSLKTNGFRKFPDDFSSNFYDVTYISGGNHKGKTNILFAIVWAMLGSNLTGDERVCLSNNQKDDCCVELSFLDNNNQEHTITRYKHKYNTSKNFLTLDGKLIKQEDLINFYYSKSLFLSIINLSYFVDLPPVKQKELLDKYLPEVNIKDIYLKLPEEDQKKLGTIPTNAKLLIKDLDDEIKFMEQKITNLKGQIEYAEKITTEKLQIPPEFQKQQELDLAIQELDSLKSNSAISDKANLEKELEKLQREELDLTLDINKLEKELQNGKKLYQNMLTDSCCPTCKQKLENSSKTTATKQYRDNLLQQYDKQTKLKEKYKVKHFERVACEGKIMSLVSSTPTISPDTIKELEMNVHSLEQEKQENLRLHNEYTIKSNNIEKAKTDIETFKKDISLLEQSIVETQKQSDIAKQLYFNSIKAKMELADTYLQDVKIRFYKVVKSTGEIKDDFVITYKDKDFSTLSRSEKVAASLEIANMLNKITNLSAPLFIDDSESYPDFDFINKYNDTQILIAQVKKGRTLKISNGKELITGFSSNINLHRKLSKNSIQVA